MAGRAVGESIRPALACRGSDRRRGRPARFRPLVWGYYLAGYAVECGLKACIARLTNQDDFPPDRRFVEDCYTHRLERLVMAGGLKPALDADILANPVFLGNWSVAKDWQETSRYDQKTHVEAQTLYDAIATAPDGVLPWIRTHW